MSTYTIRPSSRPMKKYQVTIKRPNNRTKTIYFGQAQASDFTKNNIVEMKKNYIKRHEKRENWTISGVNTAGFWSRWVLWNLPTIKRSVKDIKNRFGINVKLIS